MGKNTKDSSKEMTQLAVKTLQDKGASQTAKSLAASVLAQNDPNKQTGAQMEDLASKVLKSDKYNDDTKSLAGSVLSQSNKDR
jgi:hypothetical protein